MKKSFIILFILFLFSCQSISNSDTEKKPSRTTSEIRLSDIEERLNDSPVKALSIIFLYEEIYAGLESDDWEKLAELKKQANDNLLALREKAVNEERWDDVLSYSRSISSIGISNNIAAEIAAFTLAYAKNLLLQDEKVSAFLTAVRAHELKPLEFNDALLFLEKAVEARQRRAAAYFLAAAERAGGRNIPPALREYASGRDTVTDMIKGVATVIVDRGFKIERGMTYRDRIGGSAFFIDASGLMITNYHVISSEVDPKQKGYSRLYIRMGDSTSPLIPARVVGWDKALDLALLKTEIETEYVFSVIDRVIPRVGDTVLAIGSPLGLEKTVTSGIVSALGRRILQIGDSIQIDAALNSGNSGGPVIDNQGRLAGVAFSGIAQHQGLNFAIPAEMLAAALPAMLNGGKSQRPWLGLSLCEDFYGAEIIYSFPGTPSSEHRLKEGTFIKTINGKNITASQGGLIPALQKEVFLSKPDELIAFEIAGKDGTIKKHIMLTAVRPELPLLDAAKVDRREKIAAPLFGMILSPLPSTIISSNFRVDKVVRGSVADSGGISEDDPISIGRFRIMEKEEIAVMEVNIKKRRMGYLETYMQLMNWLDSPDTL